MGDQVWTPDGERLVFGSRRAGAQNLFSKAADGTGNVERLTTSANIQAPSSISLDGRTLVLVEGRPETGFDVGLLSLNGEQGIEWLLESEYDEEYAEISPDGRWMAYESDESGRFEIYVRPFPNVDEGKWQISGNGGDHPLWAPDERELFYRGPNGEMVAVPIDTESNFSAGSPDVLFEASDFLGSGGASL